MEDPNHHNRTCRLIRKALFDADCSHGDAETFRSKTHDEYHAAYAHYLLEALQEANLLHVSSNPSSIAQFDEVVTGACEEFLQYLNRRYEDHFDWGRIPPSRPGSNLIHRIYMALRKHGMISSKK